MLILIFNSNHLFSQSKYIFRCREDVLVLSESIALSEAGTIENKNNSGEVEKYLKSAGLSKGQPYCAAGQYYCFAEAVRILHLPVQLIPIKKTGNANQMFEHGIQNEIKSKYVLSKHDLIVWRKGKSKRGHIERVIIPGKAGWATTVGFNVRIYAPYKYKYVEGVFIMQRNIYHPLNRMKVRGIIGFTVITGRK